MKQRVGIEALAIAVPHRYVELEDLARARGVDPAKYTIGLGGRQMAVADPGEDSVALAATAAARLIRTARVDPARIGLLTVGTESGVDHSKAVASHVQGLLKLPRSMRVFDVQHACYGGTAALMAATEWVASGVGAGRCAIVICSDIARYEMKSAGEPTQGGGAVALLVSEKPELFELDMGLNGTYAADVYDFWRPLGRKEAVVDGHYSISCYLDALSGAYAQWRERALAHEVVRGSGATLPSEQLARIAYHVPFCKMARKAHAQVRKVDLEARYGGKLSPAAEEAEVAATTVSFEAQVASTLNLCAQTGNAYTASLYFGLAGLLQLDAASLVEKRIGLFSYGSGSSAEFFSGVVGAHAAEKMAASGVGEVMAGRERISIEEYEQLQRLPADSPLALEPMPGAFRLVELKDHRRCYAEGPTVG